jgi:hypothetical protein
MMSDVPLETCWAFNKLWSNKFYYKAASCWYFYWVVIVPTFCAWFIFVVFGRTWRNYITSNTSTHRSPFVLTKRRLQYLVNKVNFVHNLFLVYFWISTCFGLLCAHHQEKQLCLCDAWYLLFCVDDRLVCTLHTRHSFPVDGPIVARNM